MSRLLKPLDATWLLLESGATPMHVAGLFIFDPPKGAPAGYLRELAERFRAAREVAPPWNCKLDPGWLGRVLPSWVEDHDLDLDYHFRHSALPQPGGERELGVLVSRLHSHALDMSRPLWEFHLIEGLANARFAMYFKMHHSLIDGVSGIRLLLRWLSADPTARGMAPIWTIGSAAEAWTPQRAAKTQTREVPDLKAAANGLGQSLWRIVRAAVDDNDPLVAPYASPRSMLSGPMNGQRRFATQQLDLARMRRLAKASGGTLNDLVLYLCGTVLRRYMLESGPLPRDSLTAAVPVSLRDADDQGVGDNQIATIFVTLGTDIADPLKRIKAIQRSSAEAKRHQKALPRAVQLPYLLLTAGPSLLAQMVRLDQHLPPLFSVGISNVPGSDEPRYLDGARLQAVYPLSLLMRGGALNITCVSIDGKLNFGFTGARDSLPRLQRMALYLGEAADELEGLLGSEPKPAASKRVARKRVARKPG